MQSLLLCCEVEWCVEPCTMFSVRDKSISRSMWEAAESKLCHCVIHYCATNHSAGEQGLPASVQSHHTAQPIRRLLAVKLQSLFMNHVNVYGCVSTVNMQSPLSLPMFTCMCLHMYCWILMWACLTECAHMQDHVGVTSVWVCVCVGLCK